MNWTKWFLCTSLSQLAALRYGASRCRLRHTRTTNVLPSTSMTTLLPNKNEPRLSASLVIVNKRNEILLVHRNPHARSFGGMHVFPGGNIDTKQDESLAMTAIRETFEETGLLLASSQSSSSKPPPPLLSTSNSGLDEARDAIHMQKMQFQTFLAEHGLQADISSVLPFTEWITPVNVPRRFRTQFFVAFLPSSEFSLGDKEERRPNPDGGQEVISARFLHPKDALAEFRQGKINLMPPQFYILFTINDILQGSVNTSAQRREIESLSRGLFGRMVINPKPLRDRDEEGRMTLTFEGDHTRGGSEGRLHRSLVKVTSSGVTTEITLQRNFDIFSEIEPQAFSASSRL